MAAHADFCLDTFTTSFVFFVYLHTTLYRVARLLGPFDCSVGVQLLEMCY
jgi:hypothetical protein